MESNRPGPLTDRLPDRIKGLFGGGSSDPSSPASTDTDSESTVLTDENTTPEEILKSSGLEITVPLIVDFEFGPTPPMTVEEKRTARNRYNTLLAFCTFSLR